MCRLDERALFVAKVAFVFGIDGKLRQRVFHFADIYHLVIAVYQQIDLFFASHTDLFPFTVRFPHSGHRLRESPCPNRLSYTRSGTGGADVSQDGVQYCMCQQRRSRQEFQFSLRKRQMDACSRVRHYLFPGGHQRRTCNICQIFGQSKP